MIEDESRLAGRRDRNHRVETRGVFVFRFVLELARRVASAEERKGGVGREGGKGILVLFGCSQPME